MPTSICPECEENVFVDAESEQGQSVACEECGAELVIVGLDPIELDLQDYDSDFDGDEDEEYDPYE